MKLESADRRLAQLEAEERRIAEKKKQLKVPNQT